LTVAPPIDHNSDSPGYNIRWLLRSIARLGPKLVFLRLLTALSKSALGVKSSLLSRPSALAWWFGMDRLQLPAAPSAIASASIGILQGDQFERLRRYPRTDSTATVCFTIRSTFALPADRYNKGLIHDNRRSVALHPT